jgi:mannose-6-phosphate isomerase-like protein (cupin superfamily)
MEKKYVVKLAEGTQGVLHGNGGSFNILLDKDSCGAQHFALLVNTMFAGVKGSAHKHDVNEHGWYIMSGTGTFYVDDQAIPIGPGMAVFAPADKMHKIDVGPDEDLTYVVVYSPAGPEQMLKEKGAHAFDAR